MLRVFGYAMKLRFTSEEKYSFEFYTTLTSESAKDFLLFHSRLDRSFASVASSRSVNREVACGN